MADNTTLKVTIIGDSHSAQSAVSGVGKESDRLSGKLKSFGGFAARALGGAAILAGGMGIAGAKMGIEVAAGNEQAQIGFTTMLGSAKKANEFLGKLQKFAAATPFEFPELQTAASSLISAGINANKVIPIMTTLGNVTSGMGTGSEGIQRATVALQQMNAAGKISGEDLNQLRDAGIPVYDLLSKATGKSKAEVVKLAQAGKLGHKELGQMMKALETGKGLERFSGLMEKQSASLTGLWSTFKDTLGQGLANAIQPIIPLLKDGLGKASAYLAIVLPKVANGLKNLVTLLPKVFAGAKGLYDLIVKGDYTGALSKAFGWEEDSSQVDHILKIRDAVVNFFDSLKSKSGSSPMDGMATGIDKLKQVWDRLQPTFDKFRTGLPQMAPIGQKIGDIFKFIADHADVLARWLPVLVTGFLLLKGAQQANSVVGKDSVIGLGMQVAANMSLAASHFALAGAIKGSTLAQDLGTKATGRQRVAAILSAIAQKVVAVASRTWAAVQWLVNAALTANPIGIVIVAIAALAAGVVWAYKNVGWFKTAVDVAFKAIGAIARWLWNSAMAPFVRFLIGAFATVCDWIGNMLDALSNIPGFGWAKDAANKMHGAADKARDLSNNIKDIPDNTNAYVTTHFSYPGYQKSLSAHVASKLAAMGDRGFATGGTSIPSGLAWVGERGPELMYVPGGSSIYNARESARMARGGGSAGGDAPGGDVHVYVTVQGSVTAERDLAMSLRNELVKIGKRNGGKIFP